MVFNESIKDGAYWVIACLLVMAVVSAGMADLLYGDAVPIWDADNQFAPYFLYVGDCLHSGSLMLWNPFTNCGSPDFIEPQWGAFSPVLLIFAAFSSPSIYGYILYWYFMVCLGGVGMLFLSRHLNFPPWLGVCGALGFAGSGFFTGHAQHMSFISAIAWLPWVVWRMDAAMVEQRRQPAAEAGVCWGLSALAGYPGVVIAVGLFTGLWWVGRTIQLRMFRGRELRLAAMILCMWLIIGAVISLPPYLGMITEGSGFSYRSGALDRDYAISSNAMAPSMTATLINPYLSVLHTDLFPGWAGIDRSLTSLYVPLMLLTGAIVALLTMLRSGRVRWLVFLAILFFFAAFRPPCPVRGWLYDLLPPFRYFRHAGLLRGLFQFAVVVLGMYGWRSLMLLSPLSRRRSWFLFLIVILLAVPGFGVLPAIQKAAGDHPGGIAAVQHWMLVWSGLLLVAILLLKKPMQRPRWVIPLICMTVCSADIVMSYRSSRFIMYDSGLKRGLWEQMAAHHVPGLDLLENGMERIPSVTIPEMFEKQGNKNLIVKVPVLEAAVPLANQYLGSTMTHPVLQAAALGADRIWFVPAVAELPIQQETFMMFGDRCTELNQPVLLVHSPEERFCVVHTRLSNLEWGMYHDQIQALPPLKQVPYSCTEYTPCRLQITVDLPQKGWLLVTDRWAPSWRAMRNGERVTPYIGNFIFRAVKLPEGISQVTFDYRPLIFPFLAAVSWSVMVLVLCRSILVAVRGRKPIRTGFLQNSNRSMRLPLR